jgi:hypothetical protein
MLRPVNTTDDTGTDRRDDAIAPSTCGRLGRDLASRPRARHQRTNRADQEREYEQAEERDGQVRAEKLRPPYQVPSRDERVDAHHDKDQPQAELDLAQHLPCA